MKRIITLAVVVIFTMQLSAQTSVYHEFPDSNAVWNITAQGCCMFDCAGPPIPNPIINDELFSYAINGDTTINSTVYHKLYKSGSTHQHCAYGNAVNYWWYYSDYVCAFREDVASRKVYMVGASSSTEYLWLNFSAGVGDTVDLFDPCSVVTSIDSILIGNNYRKKFNVTSSNGDFIIEGIGRTTGLFEPLCPFEYFGTLTCFSQDGQTLYPDTVTTCDIITSVEPPPAASVSFTVSPNPIADNVWIACERPLHDATLTVRNSLGQVVMEMENLDGSMIECSVGSLESGVYFFQLSETDRVISTVRAVRVE